MPVPHVRTADGTPLSTDPVHALKRWLDTYERLIGRLLADTDPLFIHVHGQVGKRLGENGIAAATTSHTQLADLLAEISELRQGNR